MENEEQDIKEPEFFDFGTALNYLKSRRKVARKNWNGKGMYIMAQLPDENSKMNRPYIFIKGVDGCMLPWVASQTDLFAEDWFIVD